MSTTYSCEDRNQREAGLRAAVSAVRDGELVVMPTDTLYGIGCNAFDNQAVAQLLAAKHRGRDMPIAVLVGSWATVQGLVREFPEQTKTLIEAFWPGGLSLIVPQAPSLPWDLGDTRGTVMLRMPLHPIAIELLREVGPMAVSSANISGQTSPTTVTEAERQLGRSVKVYLDDGESPVGQASTIVDLSGPNPVVLREGAISTEQIAEVLELSAEDLRRKSS
ncbi:L-threonylcarbamoyladenylate synthase [Corynebacterium sp.]|uniref:L-threonylcarbamoyladenylate synthase n=1 Tax=Corynebacterium sp. TaxID=1720 RepID=UPI0027B9ABA5|nr:L-threonylcarbamoyladenylate synthase [Corynebacterium sp.]